MRDIDVRRALCSKLEADHATDVDCVRIQELELCQGAARVDLAVVNGTLHGFEIKSERDTLSRLPSQIRTYNESLEYVTIVAASKHLAKVSEMIPNWWGIWLAIETKTKIGLQEIRAAIPNPEIASYALAQYLWRDEAIQALEIKQQVSGLRNKPRRVLWAKLVDVYRQPELAEVVRSAIKRRPARWRVDPPSK